MRQCGYLREKFAPLPWPVFNLFGPVEAKIVFLVVFIAAVIAHSAVVDQLRGSPSN